MPSVSQGSSATIFVPANRVLRVKTTGEAFVDTGFSRRRRVLSGETYDLRATDKQLKVTLTANTGTITYTTFYTDVVPFTGDFTLSPEDDGKIFRCDDASNVTVTVPATLPECFSAGFLMWGAGSVTVAAGSGATKRSSTSALSTQYNWGSLLVVKNADDASAEFVLGGGFA